MILERELARIQAICETEKVFLASEPFTTVVSGSSFDESLSSAELTSEELNLASQLGGTAQPQFVAGRIAAHRALSKISDYRQQPILRYQGSRLPDFPGSYIGSIAHSRLSEPANPKGIALACISTEEDYDSLGIDLELSGRPCNDSLIGRITLASDFSENLRAIEVFCLKEAIYKCAFAFDKRVRSFRELTLSPPAAATDAAASFDKRFLTTIDLDVGTLRISSGLIRTESFTFALSLSKVDKT